MLTVGAISLSVMGCALLLWSGTPQNTTMLLQNPTIPTTTRTLARSVPVAGVRPPMPVHAQLGAVQASTTDETLLDTMPMGMATEATAGSDVMGMSLLAVVGGVAGFLFGRYFQAPTRRLESQGYGSGQIAMAYASGMRPTHTALRLSAGSEEAEMEAEELQVEAEEKMDKAIEAAESKFGTVRTGRASPALLDRVRVSYYGALTPLRQLASVNVPDATTLVISPFDKTALQEIEKAIGGDPDLGLTCNNDGEKIRINVPALTSDRRKEMVKLVSKMGEEGKVQIRNIRRDVLKAADKLDLSEDAAAGFKTDVQKLTDNYTKKIEKMVELKEKELTTV